MAEAKISKKNKATQTAASGFQKNPKRQPPVFKRTSAAARPKGHPTRSTNTSATVSVCAAPS